MHGSDGVPTLKFYLDFPNEWENFSPEIREELGEFLERLQGLGPLNPDLLGECDVYEPYYACQLVQTGAVVYWKLEYRSGLMSLISTTVEKIVILAIETGN